MRPRSVRVEVLVGRTLPLRLMFTVALLVGVPLVEVLLFEASRAVALCAVALCAVAPRVVEPRCVEMRRSGWAMGGRRAGSLQE